MTLHACGSCLYLSSAELQVCATMTTLLFTSLIAGGRTQDLELTNQGSPLGTVPALADSLSIYWAKCLAAP